MKKVYLLLLAAGMFTFVACNEGGGNSEGDATEAEEVVEETTEAATEEVAVEAEEAGEELADHVCNDNCTEEACNFACGEKGHTCSEACHSHEDGDGHDHEEAGDEGAEG